MLQVALFAIYKGRFSVYGDIMKNLSQVTFNSGGNDISILNEKEAKFFEIIKIKQKENKIRINRCDLKHFKKLLDMVSEEDNE